MINVQLTPAMFAPGGLFYGTDRSRAVLVVGAARNDLVVGKRNSGDIGAFDYRGFQNGLYVDARGTEFEDIMLETIMKNEGYRCTYGAQLLDFVERGYVQVYQDGVIITALALRTYTAP
jgi:hypothetical protein